MESIQTFGLTVALTELLKNAFKLSGTGAQILGVVVGTILGIVEKTAQIVPVDYAGWVGVVLYGLGMGLGAVGLYQVASTKLALLSANPKK